MVSSISHYQTSKANAFVETMTPSKKSCKSTMMWTDLQRRSKGSKNKQRRGFTACWMTNVPLRMSLGVVCNNAGPGESRLPYLDDELCLDR